jgi:hypothetical protein
MKKYQITTKVTVDLYMNDDFDPESETSNGGDILTALDAYVNEQGDWRTGFKMFEDAVVQRGHWHDAIYKVIE